MTKKHLTYMLITFILSLSFPISTFADTIPSDISSSAPATDTTTPSSAPDTTPAPAASPAASSPAPTSSSTNTGPTSPTGADAATYTFNKATGLWENQYYTWNPVTHQTQPKTPQDYSYNPATGMWDTTKYVYDAPSGTYLPNVVSTSNNPQAAQTPDTNSIATTGPGSNNAVYASSNNNATFDLFYNAKISNNINQSATSGDASVIGNTVAGNALTGNALDVNNIINLLKSSFGLQNAANLLTFTENINGDINGDIVIDPNQINPSSVALSNSSTQNNLIVNASDSGLINNDIILGSNSGNATVSDNTNAGSATTGNANSVANIVNVLNSAIAANKSFLGVININGNLNGDILLPPNFLDQLLASNAPRASVNISNNNTNNVLANSANNETIGNNVNLAATSGNATVSDNTKAGSALTGSAGTNLTIFNLTGKQIVSKDNLLVFVNVLGQWVGLIMNAPAGTTAADIGGGVTENNNVSNNATINQTSNNTINNNLKIGSKSGDALVTDNTNAGDAKSGNASASANIANILDSQLSASDWFGLLFINVLGVWHGSFGVNTAAGDSTTTVPGSVNGITPTLASVFRFIPKNTGVKPQVYLSRNAQGLSSTVNPSDPSHQVVLASATCSNHGNSGSSAAPTESLSKNTGNSRLSVWILPLASFVTVMILTGGIGMSSEFTDKIHARLLANRLSKS